MELDGKQILTTNQNLASQISITVPTETDYKSGSIKSNEQIFSYQVIPAKSADSETLAFLAIIADETISLLEQQKNSLIAVIASVIILLVAMSVLAYYLNRIFKPVSLVVSELKHAAEGDLDRDLSCLARDGNDEFTELARTAMTFVETSAEAKQLQQERDKFSQKHQKEQAEREAIESISREKEQKFHQLILEKAEEQKTQSLALQERVDQLREAVSAAHKGQLSYTIDVEGDDIAGQMGGALKSFFADLSGSMTGITGNASQLTQASESLTSLSKQINASAVSNSDQTKQAAALTNEVRNSVESIASATEQMSSSIKK